jgi:hypothetical protein
MRIDSIGALNVYLAEFYRPSIDAVRRGEKYKAPQPQRTADAVAAAQPDASRPGTYLGRFRHTHEHITRLPDEEEQNIG